MSKYRDRVTVYLQFARYENDLLIPARDISGPDGGNPWLLITLKNFQEKLVSAHPTLNVAGQHTTTYSFNSIATSDSKTWYKVSIYGYCAHLDEDGRKVSTYKIIESYQLPPDVRMVVDSCVPVFMNTGNNSFTF